MRAAVAKSATRAAGMATTTEPRVGGTTAVEAPELAIAELLAVGCAEGEDREAQAHGDRTRADGRGGGPRLERVGHGDDIDPGPRCQRAADRLVGLHRQRECDLARPERRPEAEGS